MSNLRSDTFEVADAYGDTISCEALKAASRRPEYARVYVSIVCPVTKAENTVSLTLTQARDLVAAINNRIAYAVEP